MLGRALREKKLVKVKEIFKVVIQTLGCTINRCKIIAFAYAKIFFDKKKSENFASPRD